MGHAPHHALRAEQCPVEEWSSGEGSLPLDAALLSIGRSAAGSLIRVAGMDYSPGSLGPLRRPCSLSEQPGRESSGKEPISPQSLEW